MGPYRGAQTELLRVPWADTSCIRPGEAGDAREDDFVLLADTFVTGWHATVLADAAPSDTVAVFGAGTIGLLAAYSAQMRGAGDLYSIDQVDARPSCATWSRAAPPRAGRMVTHHAGLDEAPELYREFDRREYGVIKAVLIPESEGP
jgi:glutathione-independent formaldehyde dehydrogenase